MWCADELSAAMRGNHPEVVQWLYANVPPPFTRGVSKTVAVDSGNLAILQWALAVDPPEEQLSLVQDALDTNSFELIKWVFKNGFYAPGELKEVRLSEAARSGRLDVISGWHSAGLGGGPSGSSSLLAPTGPSRPPNG